MKTFSIIQPPTFALDSAFRFFQYFLKLVIPLLDAQGARFSDLIAKLKNFYDSMALTRKVLRFGMPLTLLNNIIKRFNQHQKRGVTMIFWRTLQDFCTALYFITDHPLYFQKLGIIELNKAQKQQIQYYSNFFWFLSAVFEVMCDVVDLYHIQREIQACVRKFFLDLFQKQGQLKRSSKSSQSQKAQEIKESLRLLYRQHFLKLLSIVRCLADMPTSVHFMGTGRIGGQAAGLFGTISSVIALYNQWGIKA